MQGIPGTPALVAVANLYNGSLQTFTFPGTEMVTLSAYNVNVGGMRIANSGIGPSLTGYYRVQYELGGYPDFAGPLTMLVENDQGLLINGSFANFNTIPSVRNTFEHSFIAQLDQARTYYVYANAGIAGTIETVNSFTAAFNAELLAAI